MIAFMAVVGTPRLRLEGGLNRVEQRCGSLSS